MEFCANRASSIVHRVAPKSPTKAIAEVADTLLAYVAINNMHKQCFSLYETFIYFLKYIAYVKFPNKTRTPAQKHDYRTKVGNIPSSLLSFFLQ